MCADTLTILLCSYVCIYCTYYVW